MQDIDKPIFSFKISLRTLLYALIFVAIVAAIILGPRLGFWEYRIDPLTFLALTAVVFYMEKMYREVSSKLNSATESNKVLESTSTALIISEPSKKVNNRNTKKVLKIKK